jgi:uncharacterized repeat protein (TIGR01451 family)
MTLTADIDPSATGALTNTVTVAPPAGVTDTDLSNNTATDTDTLTPQFTVTIVKSDNKGGSSSPSMVGTAVPGTDIVYTIVVHNQGPSTATQLAVHDQLPAALTGVTWSGSDGSAGTGNTLADTIASLLPGASVTYTVSGHIDPAATGTLVNTATVDDHSATDIDNLTPQSDVRISKTDNTNTAVPGTMTTYTIVVTNDGPSTATNLAVNDALPNGVLSATWVGSNGSSGTGSLADSIASLAPGASVSYTFTVQIDPSATGTLVNVATVSVPPGDNTPQDNTATDTDTLTPRSDVQIAKVDNRGGSSVTGSKGVVVPGGTITYTIVVTNSGPSTAANLRVTDIFPAGILSPVWTAVASSGSQVVQGSGAGNINTNVTLLPGGSVTFTIFAYIRPSAHGTLRNTARVTVPLGDETPGNNVATDMDLVRGHLSKSLFFARRSSRPVPTRTLVLARR